MSHTEEEKHSTRVVVSEQRGGQSTSFGTAANVTIGADGLQVADKLKEVYGESAVKLARVKKKYKAKKVECNELKTKCDDIIGFSVKQCAKRGIIWSKTLDTLKSLGVSLGKRQRDTLRRRHKAVYNATIESRGDEGSEGIPIATRLPNRGDDEHIETGGEKRSDSMCCRSVDPTSALSAPGALGTVPPLEDVTKHATESCHFRQLEQNVRKRKRSVQLQTDSDTVSKESQTPLRKKQKRREGN